ncbi:MAG: hypothetical protein LBB72_08600 [Spirochaetaceae bacterium]|nr:hypothetical protein [Spirochaetaceae bacterium]
MTKKLLIVLAGMVLAASLVMTGCEEIGGAEPPARKIMRPYISEQPESHSYHIGGAFTAPALTVKISEWKKADGALSYQWYKFTSIDAYFTNEGGEGIGEETEIDYENPAVYDPDPETGEGDITLSYTPDNITSPQDGDRFFYYVVVFNRDGGAGDAKIAQVQSEIAAISFSAAGAPLYPIIVTNPVSATYSWGAAMNDLRVKAKLPPDSVTGDELTYKWRMKRLNASEVFVDEDIDEDANLERLEVSFQKHRLTLDRNIFFVEVTNTSASSAAKTAVSIPAILNIKPAYAAAAPVINVQPKDKFYFLGSAIEALSVEGESTDAGVISYQWYSNTANSNKGGTAVSGATSAAYTPNVPNNTAKNYFYYAVVTNTNQYATNTKTASVSSVPARISVAVSAAAADTANVYLTIRDVYQSTNQFQYIRGYGGMDVAWGNFPRTTRDDTELMYDPDRLGYNMLRIMIKADYTDPADTINMLLTGDRPDYYENVKIVNKYGGYVAASPWTPPKAWKSNNSINGGGILIPSYYPLFAEYLRKFAQNMADNGAPIYCISISNEPNYVAGYDGCEWTSEEMRNFFVSAGHFTTIPTAVRGWGGGRETPWVLTMNGESANSPYINNAALENPTSKAAIDVLARHIYGERTKSLWNDYPELLQIGSPDDINKGKMEVWMTEHNINSANATGYYNDSTWAYVWRFLNDVDLVLRLNNENAFVWWASKRFYSMVGDGQFGTTDGSPLPRGWGLAHYARFTTGMTRVGIGLTPNTTSRMLNNTVIAHTDQSNSILNSSVDDMDNVSARVTAFISEDKKEISLVMWTPQKTNKTGGYGMGTVRVELPSHSYTPPGGGADVTQRFTVNGVTAVRSFGDRASQLFQPYDVKLSADRTVLFVDVPIANLVSIKLTGEWVDE